MREPESGAPNKVFKIVFDDIHRINETVPRERVLLKRALEGELVVPLRDGTEHLMDADEVAELARSLPSWMKWLVKVPFVLAYNPVSGTFHVVGSEWDEKAIKELLGLDGDERITMLHLDKLVQKFASLVFVLFEVDMGSYLRG